MTSNIYKISSLPQDDLQGSSYIPWAGCLTIMKNTLFRRAASWLIDDDSLKSWDTIISV